MAYLVRDKHRAALHQKRTIRRAARECVKEELKALGGPWVA
jgi:hypothetical protein